MKTRAAIHLGGLLKHFIPVGGGDLAALSTNVPLAIPPRYSLTSSPPIIFTVKIDRPGTSVRFMDGGSEIAMVAKDEGESPTPSHSTDHASLNYRRRQLSAKAKRGR